MKTPKTPIEFDYDLWTTEDGKCMVRVKITGEVTEVDREVMKALRAEEKRIRRALRSNEGTVKDGIAHQTRTFSLSAVSENELEKSDWLVDPTSDFANVEARLFVESAIRLLLAGLREYSSMETLTPEVVNKIIKRIEVHNSETVNGHKRVGVDIYFTGVGLVDLATIKEMLAIAESSRP